MNGHIVFIVGVAVIALGTYLTYLGQSISTKKEQDELKAEIRSKDEKINELIDAQRRSEDGRKQTIKTIVGRANILLSNGEIFLFPFLARNQRADIIDIFNEDHPEEVGSLYSSPNILDPLYELFKQTTLLKDSNMSSGDKILTELEEFVFHMGEVSREADSILQHYGDVRDPIIKVIDDLRSRSDMFAKMLPLLHHVQGGVEGVFGAGVPEQWANYFRYYYLTHLKLKQICRNQSS